jgi:hypothetical protein
MNLTSIPLHGSLINHFGYWSPGSHYSFLLMLSLAPGESTQLISFLSYTHAERIDLCRCVQPRCIVLR